MKRSYINFYSLFSCNYFSFKIKKSVKQLLWKIEVNLLTLITFSVLPVPSCFVLDLFCRNSTDDMFLLLLVDNWCSINMLLSSTNYIHTPILSYLIYQWNIWSFKLLKLGQCQVFRLSGCQVINQRNCSVENFTVWTTAHF